jgi:hypothetical protein
MSQDSQDIRGPCSLCREHSQRYYYPKTWSSEKQALLLKHKPDSLVGLESADICRACEHDLSTNTRQESYTPRWKKGTGAAPTEENMQCRIQGCSAAAKMHVKFTTTVETKQEFSNENIEQV